MPLTDQLKVINAHPRIGAPAASLSALSLAEQCKLEEPNLEATLKKLGDLNEKYEAKFGFKFIVFVNGRFVLN